MAEYKYDLFKILGNLSTRNFKYFDDLTDDQLKDIPPLVIMRWLSGTTDKRQVFFLNTLANPMVFSLHKHKRLLLKLFMICMPGKSQKFTWHKQLSKAGMAKPMSTKVVCQYCGYSKREAEDALKLLQKQDIISMAEDLGYPPEDMTKLRREHKDGKDDSDKEAPSKAKKGGFDF